MNSMGVLYTLCHMKICCHGNYIDLYSCWYVSHIKCEEIC